MIIRTGKLQYRLWHVTSGRVWDKVIERSYSTVWYKVLRQLQYTIEDTIDIVRDEICDN